MISLPGKAQKVPLLELPGIRCPGHSHGVYLELLGPNVTFTANFLLIRCYNSSAKRITSQTGALKFKNATDYGANRSWLGGGGPGDNIGNGGGEKMYYSEGCFRNHETITCWPYKVFSRHSAENVSNTCFRGQKRLKECGGSSQGVERGFLGL